MRRPERRRSVRLRGYDYAAPGAYFVTICTYRHVPLFGEVVDGVMRHNTLGEAAHRCWQQIPRHAPTVVLDAFVIRPNHVHGIILIVDDAGGAGGRGVQLNAPMTDDNIFRPVDYFSRISPRKNSLGVIVRTYKAAVTRWCREHDYHEFRWQRSYHEHIIRHRRAPDRIRRYLAENPARWAADRYHPDHR